MTSEVLDNPAPLSVDARGALRVGGTRVTLDSVIAAFKQGAAAESIAQSYPSLALADIYGVIYYYLRHTDAVDAYLTQRQREAQQIRERVMARSDQAGIRERLLTRRDRTAS